MAIGKLRMDQQDPAVEFWQCSSFIILCCASCTYLGFSLDADSRFMLLAGLRTIDALVEACTAVVMHLNC